MDHLETRHAELVEHILRAMRVSGREQGLGPVVPHVTRNLDSAARKIRHICSGTTKVFDPDEVLAVKQASENIGKGSSEEARKTADDLAELAWLMESRSA